MAVKRRLRLGLLFALLGLSGCFQRETTLTLHPDGSGTLTQRTLLTPEYLTYLKGLSRSEHPENGFNEARLVAQAGRYGPEVRYKRHRTHTDAEGLLLEVEYHVADVEKLTLALDTSLPLTGDPLSEGGTAAYPPFRFRRQGADTWIIYPPQVAAEVITAQVRVESAAVQAQREKRLRQERTQWMRFGNPFSLSGEETALELVERLGRNMRFRLEVETSTERLHTTSPYKLDSRRILLLSVSGDEFLQDSAIRKKLQDDAVQGIRWHDLAESNHAIVDTARYRILRQATK